MATLTGKLVSETYKALLKMIDNDILTESEKQISDGYGQGTGIFIDDNGFIRASVFKVTGGSSSQFLKADGSLDNNSYLPAGSTTSVIPEGSNLYFTNARVLTAPLTGFVSTEGTVTAADTVLSAFNKIWWNIENGGGGGGGYVPYTGATQNLNLGTYGLISDYIQFNLAPTSIPTTAGTMSWNAADGTADLKMGGANVTLQVGQEELVRVVNKTGANLLEANYQAVRVSGAQGNRLKVALAKADNDANSADTIGLVTETINNNQEGFVTAVGLVRNIDTTGDLQTETWADGEMLYLSSTTAGAITNIKPEAPEHGVRLGYVVRAHKTQGQIYVKVDNGYELDELHNVLITDPLDEDVLFYDEANLLWINKNIYSAINATDVGKSLLGILNAEDTTPVTTKPRGIRINVDNTVDALEVGTQGYLPFYDETDFYIDSPVFTDGTDVIIGGDTPNGTNKLTVIGGIWGEELVLNDQFLLATNPIGGNYSFNIFDGTDWITQMILSKTNLVFNISGYEKMRLNASGYLGVGTDTPTALIHAKSTVAYPKIKIDNASASGGGMFSAYQNGTEIANFGVSGAWLIDNSSDVAIVATKAGQGIQFFTNGSNSQKMAINDEGNVYIGQSPTFVAGATQLIVRGKTGAGFLGVNHYDMSIKGSINTFNSVFQVGTSTFHSVAFIVEDIERARINSGGRFLLGTTTDNTVDIFQANGSIIASAIKKSGGTSTQYLMADGSVSTLASYVPTSRTLTINGTGYDLTADRSWSVGTVTSVSASVPTGFAISGSPITSSGTLAITFASGYALPTTVKQSNWDDAYTFVTGFPSQTGNVGKYLTTNGSTLSWGTVTAGVSSFNTRTGAVTLSSTDVTTALGFTPVTQARTLSINGTAYDLSADRAWTISAGSSARNVSTFTATAGQTTFTIAGGYTPNLVDVFLNGARLTGADYTATNGTTVVLTTGVRVNDIIDVVNYLNAATLGVTGSGTSGYLPKWTGTSVVSNSLIYETNSSIGIGTISPDLYGFGSSGRYLTLQSGSGGFSLIQVISDSTSGSGINFGNTTIRRASIDGLDGSNLIFSTNATNSGTSVTERLRITSAGNIGIGVSSPETYSLSGKHIELFGGSSYSFYHFNTNTVKAFLASNESAGSSSLFTFSNHPLFLGTNNTARMVINTSGNVGIGTSSPSYKLDVSGTARITGQLNLINNNIIYSDAATNHTYHQFNRNTATGWEQMIMWSTAGTAKWYIGLQNNTSDGFSIYGAASGANAITIKSDNKIGIGTSSPTEKLHLANSGQIIMRIQNTLNASDAGINFTNNTVNAFYGVNETGAYIYTASNHPILFYSNTAERMRIDSSGNVLIGTTSVLDKLSVNGGVRTTGSGSGFFFGDRSSSNFFGWYAAGNNPYLFNGAVGNIASINPSNGAYTALSDVNKKKNFEKSNYGLAEILLLNPQLYNLKTDADTDKKDLGFIAQEVKNIIPQAYIETAEFIGLNYQAITAASVKAIQELDYKFETQAEKIARLETRVQQLEAK
jgi:hypothetical protein